MEFEDEVEKLLVTNFSVLELHLNTKGHVFGALVVRLLKIYHIRTNTQKLKVVLPWWFQMPQEARCLRNCLCDEPKDWRNQNISLTRLEEVEINNFTGRDLEVDFLKLIFRWAPMLTRMIVKLAYAIKQIAWPVLLAIKICSLLRFKSLASESV
ncbi:hypothetical protein QYE76_071861 [Lolium multiflorum]|uniref:FBD domain-containing protein n=1 Tax=Lolium multiflorum TaxID=4521 RepID=A0AAD8SME8_LOLMU|nr:hypothetical protein QYE76_071861 [Lolium multiflorum]